MKFTHLKYRTENLIAFAVSFHYYQDTRCVSLQLEFWHSTHWWELTF